MEVLMGCVLIACRLFLLSDKEVEITVGVEAAVEVEEETLAACEGTTSGSKSLGSVDKIEREPRLLLDNPGAVDPTWFWLLLFCCGCSRC